jgi:hypothetical protein
MSWKRHHYIRLGAITRTDEAARCFYIVLWRDQETHSNTESALLDSISQRQQEANGEIREQ